jgi:hypothetical protein
VIVMILMIITIVMIVTIVTILMIVMMVVIVKGPRHVCLCVYYRGYDRGEYGYDSNDSKGGSTSLIVCV